MMPVPIVPESWFRNIAKVTKFVNCEYSSGIVPFNEQPLNCKKSRNCKLPNSGGSVPPKSLFPPKVRISISDRRLNSSGTVPVKLFVSIYVVEFNNWQ